MQIAEAKLAVDQILNEERERPTIGYEDIANEWVNRSKEMLPEEIAAWNRITSVPRMNLWAQRKESPRPVTETPYIFQLVVQILTCLFPRMATLVKIIALRWLATFCN